MFGSPLDTIPLVSESSVVERIAQVCQEREVDLVVIGMPFQADGTEGEGCARARRIREKLTARGLEVALHDERWTSRDAETALRESGKTSRAMRGKTDKVAAALILQDYLRETSGG
jgi:putative Holliday junction resolvase